MKTGTHPRVKPEGMLFRIMLQAAAKASARAGSSRQMPGGSSICGLMQTNDG
jgi:hypothetical protein